MIAGMKLTRQNGADWASISPSTTERGRWQLTWWDAEGPVGHTCRDTPRECVDEALRDGLQPMSANGPDAEEALALMTSAKAEREQRLAWLRTEDW